MVNDVLTIECEAVQAGTVLHLAGRIDSQTCERLHCEIVRLFSKKLYQIILDCQKVDYLSSAGLGVLLDDMTTAQENAGGLVLLSPSTRVSTVLVLIGASDLIQVVFNMPDAMRAIQRPWRDVQ